MKLRKSDSKDGSRFPACHSFFPFRIKDRFSRLFAHRLVIKSNVYENKKFNSIGLHGHGSTVGLH